MKPQALILTGLLALGLAVPAAFAAEAAAVASAKAEPLAAGKTWTLATEDTELTLKRTGNTLSIVSLRNPAQDWNWTPKPSPVPLVAQVIVGTAPRPVTWTFREATTAPDTNGTTLTLRFTSADPALELKSVWRARPGVGPVEQQTTVRNDSQGAISFADGDLVAAQLELTADQPARLFPVASGKLGYGEGNPLPYQMIQVGNVHGLYLAYDYGCGEFASSVSGNQVASRWWAARVRDTVTAPGETFRCPGFLILAYKGDEDDGANHFRRWFWRYEITRSLYDNPQDPPIELCEWPYYDGKPDQLIERISKNRYGDWGVGLWKTDYWHFATKHAKSPELAAACQAQGMGLSMYWMSPQTEETLAAEWNRSKFNYYRMDQYFGGAPFDIGSYRSTMDFNRKIDNLATKHGIKLENCCNGGNLRSLDLFRRMTFMTHSDHSGLHPFFRHINDWSYLICPIQLKNDYVIGSSLPGMNVGESMAELRGMLLGAILTIPTKLPAGASWDNTQPVEFSATTTENLKRVFALYNTRQRAVLRGADVYHILPSSAAGQWFGIQYYNTFIGKGSVLLWQNGGPASQSVKLKGLDRQKTYFVTFEDAKGKNGPMTGAQLMDQGLSVPMGPNASEVVWLDWPELSANSDTLSFALAKLADKASPLQVAITYRGGPGSDKPFTINATDPWVKIATGTGAGNGQTFAVTVDPSGLPSAVHTAKVIVSRPDIPETIVLPVRLRFGTPSPKVVTVGSPSRRCAPKGELRFSAEAHDQFGEPFPTEVRWSVSGGGTITPQGVFTSDGSQGEFQVTANVGGPTPVSATAALRVVPPDLVSRWKLDETNGTVAADAWGINPGTLVGNPTWVTGKRGGALRFNGKNQFVDTGWTLQGLNLPCSFAFWVNPDAVQGLHANIFGNHTGSTHGIVMQQESDAHNKFSFGYGSKPAPGGAGPVQLTASVWQHVAIVCDGKEVVIYLDGKEVAHGAGAGPLTPNPNLGFRLASGYSEGRFFAGALDDFRIYARALVAEEVMELITTHGDRAGNRGGSQQEK